MLKKQLNNVTTHPIGAVVGAAAGYYIGKKVAHLHTWGLGAAVVVGVLAGAFANSKLVAAKSVPTADTVKA